jgi:lipopolysaccharide transport system ATP-binding protein
MRIIDVSHVTKEFRLGQLGSLRQTVAHGLALLRGQEWSARTPFRALSDIDFNVNSGEVLGIIGANGAGKSTLLKLLARITTPTSGSINVRGKIAPLIEVGAGLIADLTGRENIYLNGMILGMRYHQIRRKFDEIVQFAEVEDFIDTPIKRYSSGMTMRLGFSIATSVDADILIVDEVLAVGDLAFQRKCFDRMENMIKRQGKTVLLVSHNTRQVERLCTRVLLIDHGRVVADDVPGKVCGLFYERSDEQIKLIAQSSGSKWKNVVTSEDVEVSDVDLVDAHRRPTNVIKFKDDIGVRLRFTAHKELRSPFFGVGVHTTDLLYLTTHNSDEQVPLECIPPGQYEITCRVRNLPLIPGVYALRVGITEDRTTRTLFYGENLVHFQVINNPNRPLSGANRHGFFALDAEWSRPQAVDKSGDFAPSVISAVAK